MKKIFLLFFILVVFDVSGQNFVSFHSGYMYTNLIKNKKQDFAIFSGDVFYNSLKFGNRFVVNENLNYSLSLGLSSVVYPYGLRNWFPVPKGDTNWYFTCATNLAFSRGKNVFGISLEFYTHLNNKLYNIENQFSITVEEPYFVNSYLSFYRKLSKRISIGVETPITILPIIKVDISADVGDQEGSRFIVWGELIGIVLNIKYYFVKEK